MTISEKKLREMLEEHRKLIADEFKLQIENLKTELKETQYTLNVTNKIATDNANEIVQLKSELESLKENQEVLKNQVDDLTNRNMRKTIIFRGVSEVPHENWAATEQILVDLLVRQLNVAPETASRMIERAHRGKRTNNNNNKQTPPPIYAKFYDWKDSQLVLDRFKKLNFTQKNLNIFTDQMYSPFLTARRNQALIERKSLKESGTIVSGYVAYPANLMVKKTGDKGYTKHQSF